MDQQTQFDFPRAAKLRALERVACAGGSAHVKSLLKALDGFARDAESCTETLRRISVSMGVSISTAKRARAAAVELGVLTVFGDPTHGQSNTYHINWQAVFSLPDGLVRPRSKTSPTPVNLTGAPGQPDRGPRSTWTGPPVNLTGVSTTDRNDQINATIRPATPKNQDGGGGGFGTAFPNADSATPRGAKPIGWWAWSFDRSALRDTAEMVRLFKAAVDAGFLENKRVDRVRFVALVLHTDAQESIRNVCGYVVTHVERATWNYLSRDSVKSALAKLAKDGLVLTPEEIHEVRQPGHVTTTKG